MAFHRWLYRHQRPNLLARLLNRAWSFLHARGIWPNYLVTLEVIGRQSGKPIQFPLALITLHGERYLVSMLGDNTNWVRNLRAAGGQARLLHGRQEQVLLEAVLIAERAPILKEYTRRAPGARPHIPVDYHAPLAAFARIAADYPVFRVKPRQES